MGTCSCQCHSPWASVIPPCCICECKNKLNPSMGSYWMPDNSIEDRINHTQDGIEKCFNRIEKIEGDMNHVPSFDYINEHIAILTKRIDDLQINQTITKCENAYKIDSLKLRSIYSRLDEIFYEFHNLREIVESDKEDILERINELENFKHLRFTKFETKPHKCPICNGKGSPQIDKMMCLGCDDEGIVWG